MNTYFDGRRGIEEGGVELEAVLDDIIRQLLVQEAVVNEETNEKYTCDWTDWLCSSDHMPLNEAHLRRMSTMRALRLV